MEDCISFKKPDTVAKRAFDSWILKRSARSNFTMIKEKASHQLPLTKSATSCFNRTALRREVTPHEHVRKGSVGRPTKLGLVRIFVMFYVKHCSASNTGFTLIYREFGRELLLPSDLVKSDEEHDAKRAKQQACQNISNSDTWSSCR